MQDGLRAQLPLTPCPRGAPATLRPRRGLGQGQDQAPARGRHHRVGAPPWLSERPPGAWPGAGRRPTAREPGGGGGRARALQTGWGSAPCPGGLPVATGPVSRAGRTHEPQLRLLSFSLQLTNVTRMRRCHLKLVLFRRTVYLTGLVSVCQLFLLEGTEAHASRLVARGPCHYEDAQTKRRPVTPRRGPCQGDLAPGPPFLGLQSGRARTGGFATLYFLPLQTPAFGSSD